MTQDTVQPLIEMTVLTENDPAIVRLVCTLTEHMTAQGGHLVVTDDSQVGRFMAGYHFAQEEPGSELAGGAAYAISDTVAGALTDVAEQVGLQPKVPALEVQASWFLNPVIDVGELIQEWLDSAAVREWLTAQARRNLANPLFAGSEQRERWEAFATLPDHGPRRG